MAILTNNLLFNHTYLKDLTADTSIDPNIPFAPRDLGDWYNARNTSSTQTLVASWVQPMLSLLELEIHAIGSGEEHIFELTTAYDHDSAIGICYVTPPGADLDTTTKGRFWMAQAVLAARRHEPTLHWVILTNGDLWRLLDAQALRRYEAYVQIDVGQLARGASDPSALRVFFRCFYRNAFEQDVDGKTGIEKLLDASDHATEKAEKHLKERVSGTDGIMAQLCLGLVRSTGKSKFTDEERDAIYRDATTLLYRMLFLLYAESRGLLPVDNPNYAKFSMQRLVEAAKEGQQRGLDQPQAAKLWSSLKRLSNAIYESDPNLDIPAYNGGLFDDDDHPYLRDRFIADQFLSRALFDLTFLQNGSDIRSIDYRDLSVRHLGSLYEGMIEYKLFIAEEPMLARRDKNGIIHFMTQEEGGGLRRNDQEIKAGEVYFAQSSGERRATGTYYTPEHIVDYIVHNTVVRGLEERRTSLEEKLNAWSGEILTSDPSERIGLQSTVDEELLKFVEEQVLTFTVCDPAMGSGHFLVNAAHNIADFIVETLNLTTWENLRLDTAPGYWRRRVAERCLYGVDISEMAVELAKLSLWLATMAQGKPLSFLKHHLKRGNSLIGAKIEDILIFLNEVIPSRPTKKEQRVIQTGQLSMLDDPAFKKHFDTATQLLRNISTRVSYNLADVKAQDTDYEQVLRELWPFILWGNMLLAGHFGKEMTDSGLMLRIQDSIDKVIENQPFEDIDFQEITGVAKEKLFFHWELEFPDVFFDSSNGGIKKNGFSVVVGNPPYINAIELNKILSEYEKPYWQSKFSSARGAYDIFVLFIEHALTQVTPGGLVSLITPNKYLSSPYAVALRQYLLDNHTLYLLFDVSRVSVFENVAVYPVVSGFKSGIDPNIKHIKIDVLTTNGDIRTTFQDKELLSRLPDNIWGFILSDGIQIVKKISDISSSLKDVSEVVASSTASEAYAYDQIIIDKENAVGKNALKLISTGTIDRFDTTWGISSKPMLILNKDTVTVRRQKQYKSPKLIFAKLATNIEAFLDLKGEYASRNTNFAIATRDEIAFLGAVCNSRLLSWIYNEYFGGLKMGGGYLQYQAPQLRNLPIRRINNTSDITVRNESATLFPTLYENYIDTADIDPIIGFANYCLLQSPSQTEVIKDLLVYLGKNMVDMNASKQKEVSRFIAWLENEVGISIENLSGKTKIWNFLGDYQKSDSHLSMEELTGTLIKNNHILTVDISNRGFGNLLLKHYQDCLEILLPIKKRLALTDQLIDQIVYRLYGLTDEEIRIVEGK